MNTVQIYRTTIDLTTDAGSDIGEATTEFESCDELSPVRRLHKQFRSTKITKTHRRKRMPPELRVIPAKVLFHQNKFHTLHPLLESKCFRIPIHPISPTKKNKPNAFRDREVHRRILGIVKSKFGTNFNVFHNQSNKLSVEIDY